MNDKKKILVTGGAGFIGSALTKRLLDEGHTVVVIDNFNTYYDVTLKRARQEYFLKNATVVEADITDKEALEKLFSEHKFDVVCHLAAQAGVRYSIENPSAYIESNIVGTANIVETMKRHAVSKIVFASTSSVYGNTSPLPCLETTSADRPVSIYAATKRSGELLLHSYAAQFGMQVTCLRFFTVYGPWGRPDMALFSFTKNIKAGLPIDVFNNGDHRRDFTYIDDIVDGFARAVTAPVTFEVINLGNNSPVDLLTYIATLETELKLKAQMNMLPMQVGDVKETYADITKAEELLGYIPKTEVREGVRNFVAWYEEFYA